jgi:hypothetical protein
MGSPILCLFLCLVKINFHKATILKNIKYERILISFMLIAATTVFCYIMMAGYKQGVLGNSWFTRLLMAFCHLWYFVFAFPCILLYIIGKMQNMFGLCLGIVSGAAFFSVVIEFVLARYKWLAAKN